MQSRRSSIMRTSLTAFVLSAPLLTACTSTAIGSSADPSAPGGSESDDSGLVPGAELPRATGIYAGAYRVPTDPSLADAASFAMDTVDWTVAGDTVTLHYNLPAGLVGGTIPVTLSGTVPAGSTKITLAGLEGTGTCVATTTIVTCHEVFGDLGTLPVDSGVVSRIAAHDYPGPVADRLNVAAVFGSDPIGFVEIDLTRPVVDDHGPGGGSGGGGGGGHDDP